MIGAAHTDATVDEFKIQGSIANMTTDRSSKGRSVFIRIGRNVPRPAGQKARHPSWKTRLLRLAGRSGKSGSGDVVRLTAKRIGRELRIVHIHERIAAEPDPIVWFEPGLHFSWPWPCAGKRAILSAGPGNTCSPVGLTHDWLLVFRPRFLKPEDLPEFEKGAMAEGVRCHAAEAGWPRAMSWEVKQRLELQASRSAGSPPGPNRPSTPSTSPSGKDVQPDRLGSAAGTDQGWWARAESK